MGDRDVHRIGEPVGRYLGDRHHAVMGFIAEGADPGGGAQHPGNAGDGRRHRAYALHACVAGQELAAVSREGAKQGVALELACQARCTNGGAQQKDVGGWTHFRRQGRQRGPEQNTAQRVTNQNVVPLAGQGGKACAEAGNDGGEVLHRHHVAKGAGLHSGFAQLPQHWPPREWGAPHTMDKQGLQGTI